MKTLFNRTNVAISTIALVIGVSSIAAAQGDCKGEHKGRGAHMFERLDTNKDGKITRAESKTLADQRFTSMDTNKDGAIVEAEIKAAHEKMRAEWQEKHAANKSGDKSADGSNRKGHGGHGGHHKIPGAGGFFAKLDTNKDGKVTRAEADVAETTRFNKFDKNADGAVTREEAQTAHEEMKKARSAKKEAKAK